MDPALIEDLLLRLNENPHEIPSYLVEVFTEPSLDIESIRRIIMTRTGQCPAIYDNGTHFAVHQNLTLEELQVISQAEGVIEVTGEYSGGLGSWGCFARTQTLDSDAEGHQISPEEYSAALGKCTSNLL